MAFNQFMHPRNIYRRKPNYEELAKVYPQFGAFLTSDESSANNKRPTIDYSDPNALRALTTTLLKHDFALTVTIPDGRLVPTLPMRLNYLLWIEDLLSSVGIANSGQVITGLDIGTGCCAIFPLLGVTMNKTWSFIASEVDETNLSFAKLNVEANSYSDRIKVVPGSGDSMFTQLLNSSQVGQVHFTMTNPPFFSDVYNDSFEEESNNSKQGQKLSSFHRTKVCSSNVSESVFEGGEVAFVRRIIAESLHTKDRINIYTAMLGRRKSFLEVKHLLKEYQVQGVIVSFVYTELCQGNTKRWAIAWTFSRSMVHLAKAPRIKCIKAKPMLYSVPSCIEVCAYDVKSISEYIRSLLLKDLQIPTFSMIETKKSIEFDIKSNTNTWSNQRRRRRQSKLKESFLTGGQPDTARAMTKRTFDADLQVVEEDEKMEEEGVEPRVYGDNGASSKKNKRQKASSDICKSDLTYLLHCGLKVKRDKQQVALKIVTKEMSQNKDSTLQIFQYFKNKLI